jgi:hypothetical protein
MKEKIITLKVDGAAQGQWSSLLLELNLMKQAWKPYGVNINMKASGLKNVLNYGTKVNDDTKNRRSSK